MQVQKYECNYGDGDKVPYVIFQSGAVMFNPDGDRWCPSRFKAHEVKNQPRDFEFVGYVEAPCQEAV